MIVVRLLQDLLNSLLQIAVKDVSSQIVCGCLLDACLLDACYRSREFEVGAKFGYLFIIELLGRKAKVGYVGNYSFKLGLDLISFQFTRSAEFGPFWASYRKSA